MVAVCGTPAPAPAPHMPCDMVGSSSARLILAQKTAGTIFTERSQPPAHPARVHVR